jgi:hypothetical protein
MKGGAVELHEGLQIQPAGLLPSPLHAHAHIELGRLNGTLHAVGAGTGGTGGDGAGAGVGAGVDGIRWSDGTHWSKLHGLWVYSAPGASSCPAGYVSVHTHVECKAAPNPDHAPAPTYTPTSIPIAKPNPNLNLNTAGELAASMLGFGELVARVVEDRRPQPRGEKGGEVLAGYRYPQGSGKNRCGVLIPNPTPTPTPTPTSNPNPNPNPNPIPNPNPTAAAGCTSTTGSAAWPARRRLAAR